MNNQKIMNLQEKGLYNLRIHYVWTFFSSLLFLTPIITLYYKFYGLDIQNMLVLIAVQTIFLTILELPTSTLGDTIGRVKILKYSVLASLVGFSFLFLFPNIYSFYIAILFSALGSALWSGTGNAKLQEDLEASDKKKDFGKVIGRLIALQEVGKLFTPVAIYFVLKFVTNGYQILAGLDVVAWIIAVYFVFKFKEIGKFKKPDNKKEFYSMQIYTFKNGFKYLFSHKSLLVLILLMILGNDLGYLARVLLPSLVENGIQDFLGSYVVWFGILAGIIGNLLPDKLGNKFSWEKMFVILIFFNSLFHFGAYLYSDNNLILTLFFVFISFVIGIYGPTWNHLIMSYTDIREKATVRSLFLMVVGFFEAIVLFSLSFYSLSVGLFVLSILTFIGFIVGILYFSMNNQK